MSTSLSLPIRSGRRKPTPGRWRITNTSGPPAAVTRSLVPRQLDVTPVLRRWPPTPHPRQAQLFQPNAYFRISWGTITRVLADPGLPAALSALTVTTYCRPSMSLSSLDARS